MIKIGILGGGQLGRMFIQNALNYPVEIHILDPDANAPCSKLAHNFVVGDFNDEQDVLEFAKNIDVIGIEIEHVNLKALKKLKKEGKIVVPDPDILEIIQDKGLQKEFYLKYNIPTAPLKKEDEYPLVQKLCKGGYDGKGVQVLTEENKSKKWEEASVFEEKADIKMELSVLIARNLNGQTAIYPVVEQVFNPEYNLLDYLISPARISDDIAQKAKEIGMKVVEEFDSPGIFAIELFLNQDGSIWVNETAPRVHNSGHATIEGNICSQFDMMLRCLLNLPLGDTSPKLKSAMINLIGANDEIGKAKIDGLDKILTLPGHSLHWYGKEITKPGRKMGHATIVGENWSEIIAQIEEIKRIVKIVSE